MSSEPLTPNFSAADYMRFYVAGGLCATLTHGAMTPIDVVKTRLQLEPKGSKLGMASMARQIVAQEGPTGLLTGFGPTAVGYLVQGGAKFAGFEVAKKYGVELAGSKEAAERYRTTIYIAGASAAEVVATTLLTPLEAARIRLVSDRTFANGLVSALTRVFREGTAYSGYIPILFKQVPYAIGQFATNEFAHEIASKTIPQDKLRDAGKAGEVAVQLGCGLAAGVVAAVLSHPADTLLSKINQGGGGKGGTLSRLGNLAVETGFRGIWAGLGTRILMTAGLVSGQFLLYAQIKTALGAAEGVSIAKADAETSK